MRRAHDGHGISQQSRVQQLLEAASSRCLGSCQTQASRELPSASRRHDNESSFAIEVVMGGNPQELSRPVQATLCQRSCHGQPTPNSCAGWCRLDDGYLNMILDPSVHCCEMPGAHEITHAYCQQEHAKGKESPCMARCVCPRKALLPSKALAGCCA